MRLFELVRVLVRVRTVARVVDAIHASDESPAIKRPVRCLDHTHLHQRWVCRPGYRLIGWFLDGLASTAERSDETRRLRPMATGRVVHECCAAWANRAA